MICALMLDTDDSVDFPDNSGKALGRPLSAYPIIAAKSSGLVSRIYVATSSPPVKSAALQFGGIVIDPPSQGGSAEELLRHGCAAITSELKEEGATLELLVILFANAPALTRDLIDAGIEAMQERPELDSAVSVSPYNRWNPFFAKKEAAGGLLVPYTGAQASPKEEVLFPDWGVSVIRPGRLEKSDGAGPTPWLGKTVLGLKQWGGGPVDYHWQVPSVEFWLKKHGYADMGPGPELQPLPKLQSAPKRG